MAYTVKKLAQLSGVSVRTLHFYDEVGLLKPAYYGSNGYRYYEEEQLLILQQILFFRALGIELKRIQKVLGRSDFDKIAALNSHRQVLVKNLGETKELIKTIDKTIEHLKGTKKMKDKEIYHGFIPEEKQAEYVKYLKNRLGEDHSSFAECEKNAKKATKADMEKSTQEMEHYMKELAKMMENRFTASSLEVQTIVRKHYEWLKNFWTPNRESYTGLGQMYTEFEWKKFFERYDSNHPRLASFLAEGMRVFAERELS